MATENKRMMQLRDTAANWTSNNPVLLAGEIGYESDTGNIKIGDGAKNWVTLPYVSYGDVGPRTKAVELLSRMVGFWNAGDTVGDSTPSRTSILPTTNTGLTPCRRAVRRAPWRGRQRDDRR
jgi:hypothetical protein